MPKSHKFLKFAHKIIHSGQSHQLKFPLLNLTSTNLFFLKVHFQSWTNSTGNFSHRKKWEFFIYFWHLFFFSARQSFFSWNVQTTMHKLMKVEKENEMEIEIWVVKMFCHIFCVIKRILCASLAKGFEIIFGCWIFKKNFCCENCCAILIFWELFILEKLLQKI